MLEYITAPILAQALRWFLEKTGMTWAFQDFMFKFLTLWVIAMSLLLTYWGLKAFLIVQYGYEIHWLWWLWGGTALD